jgi:hypothetical protein
MSSDHKHLDYVPLHDQEGRPIQTAIFGCAGSGKSILGAQLACQALRQSCAVFWTASAYDDLIAGQLQQAVDERQAPYLDLTPKRIRSAEGPLRLGYSSAEHLAKSLVRATLRTSERGHSHSPSDDYYFQTSLSALRVVLWVLEHEACAGMEVTCDALFCALADPNGLWARLEARPESPERQAMMRALEIYSTDGPHDPLDEKKFHEETAKLLHGINQLDVAFGGKIVFTLQQEDSDLGVVFGRQGLIHLVAPVLGSALDEQAAATMLILASQSLAALAVAARKACVFLFDEIGVSAIQAAEVAAEAHLPYVYCGQYTLQNKAVQTLSAWVNRVVLMRQGIARDVDEILTRHRFMDRRCVLEPKGTGFLRRFTRSKTVALREACRNFRAGDYVVLDRFSPNVLRAQRVPAYTQEELEAARKRGRELAGERSLQS